MRTMGRFLAALALAVPAVAEPPPAAWSDDLTPIAPADWNFRHAAHLLERAGFGGTPEEVGRLAAMTPEQAVDSLVDYEAIDPGPLPAFEPSGIYPHGHKLVGLEDVALRGFLTGKAYGIKATQDGPLRYQPAINEFYTLLISEHGEMRRAGAWWLERMLRTPRPLEEKLTLFWHDHFATSQEKVRNYELMLAQIETLRRHANGNVRELLTAMAQDPAMLVWLDNRENVKGKPNENFAREVMELFAMGEGQGYTESDIREMARAFTGWTLRPIVTTRDEAKFVDDRRLHDGGQKTFLGRTGAFRGEDAIGIIIEQPATARFLAGKLYRAFVRDELTPAVNDRLAALLQKSDYELKPLLKTIFLSRDFYSPASVATQIKGPVHYVVSTCRKLGLPAMPGVPHPVETTEALGQALFYPPNVAGWPGGRAWINPATLVTRGNFLHLLLFPDPAAYGHPDKVVAEGYRGIPLQFREYNIAPQLWNAETRRMEPVSLVEYERRLDSNAGKAMGMARRDPNKDAAIMTEHAMMGPPKPAEMKSKLAQVSAGETYNLAVGVYTGFVEGLNRVKPFPRDPASIDLVAMAKAARLTTAEATVDSFCNRFLSAPLAPARREAILAFLKAEIRSDVLDFSDPQLESILRRTVHLILSAPEYQLG